ncbi:hypothetical protein [Halarchaeum salinum]|uniref:Uncharacterized protein n=1 Tax=Halarchaeum salinum TaxID=489912 RepID=A0AAV3S3X3_9EURY
MSGPHAYIRRCPHRVAGATLGFVLLEPIGAVLFSIESLVIRIVTYRAVVMYGVDAGDATGGERRGASRRVSG